MCGIFGHVGGRSDAAQVVLSGLRALEYRGYDSWGVAVSDGTLVQVDRRTGKIGVAVTELPPSGVGLGHTRWATHGAVTVENAHPHLDCTRRLALVHNGIVENHAELRQALENAGHRFRSQTDTELIAHLIEDALQLAAPGAERLLHATLAAFRALRGLNAIGVLDVGSGALAAAKNGSPLVLGFSADGHWLASDSAALLAHTRDLCFVGDGQAVLLTRERARLFEIDGGTELEPEIVRVAWDAQSAERLGHPDYMSKEIHEQPERLARLAVQAAPSVQALASSIAASEQVFMLGCGSSAHAALVAQHLFARRGRRITAVTASEFRHLQAFVAPGTLIVALSQSGETIDVLDAALLARTTGARIAALCNVEGSSLWRMADVVVPLDAGPERCVLATKSFTAQLALLLLTAHALDGWLAQGTRAVADAATDIASMLHGARRAAISAVARALRTRQHLFVIGRGASHALALETALKIKEVSYIHAEGLAGGELKHGVMALIEPGTPCIALMPHDDTETDLMSAAMQAKARGAELIGICPQAHPMFDHHIEAADLGDASAIVHAVPAQLLGYDLARLRGHDPDMPRNLAKSVTVK